MLFSKHLLHTSLSSTFQLLDELKRPFPPKKAAHVTVVDIAICTDLSGLVLIQRGKIGVILIYRIETGEDVVDEQDIQRFLQTLVFSARPQYQVVSVIVEFLYCFHRARNQVAHLWIFGFHDHAVKVDGYIQNNLQKKGLAEKERCKRQENKGVRAEL